MDVLPRAAAAAGLGFVALLVVANLVLAAAGVPLPTDDASTAQVARAFAAGADGVRLASALMPVAWVLAVVLAAGLAVGAWDRPDARTWALVGFAGVVMQCAAFAVAEAARLALGVAAQPAVAGLWELHRATFGFNQAFLATALLGFSLSLRRARWHTTLGLVGASLLVAAATAAPYGVAAAPPGLVGWLLWLAWIAVAGAWALRGTRPATPVPARP